MYYVAVTTAENGQRALEFLGLGDGRDTENSVNRKSYKVAFKLIFKYPAMK